MQKQHINGLKRYYQQYNIRRKKMKPYILMGYGMMKMTEDLLKDWNGGNIILNPLVLN